MNWINYLFTALSVLFTLCYAYQIFYIFVPFFKKPKPKNKELHKFAIMICARNEQNVICDLIDSIKCQSYPQELLTVFVMADNCTDNTAKVARERDAVVYERFNTELVGKGYALNMLLQNIERDFPEGFDGYMVFDADNVLSHNYIEHMNGEFFDRSSIVTSYRNSKNYGDNWISAGYALWFLRESKYLNTSRQLLGTSCMISGTGFLFGRDILLEQGNWPFYLLTEDIQFSAHHIVGGKKISIASDAVLYDEQPTDFKQSWNQRLRWAKGFLQVFGKYGKNIIKKIFKGSFSAYDICMSIMPAAMISIATCILGIIGSVIGMCTQTDFWPPLLSMLGGFAYMYFTIYIVGLVTTISEWKQIHTTTFKKIWYTFTFPFFMGTYLPIAVVALCKKNVTWKPIKHGVKAPEWIDEEEDNKTDNK